MTVIPIKGDIVDDKTASFYSFFDIPAVSPAKINELINAADGDSLEVDIASSGGDVFAASEIYTALKNYQGKVIVNVQGLAASAASVIAMAGDQVNMSPTAQMMIHKAWTFVEGNADDLAHDSKMMDSTDQSIVNAYEQKTGMDRDAILKMMSDETWMTAQVAVDKGFADQIMFVDDKQPQVVNAAAPVVPKAAVNKLLNLISKSKQAEATEQSQPTENTTEEQPTPSLKDQKLAILLGKESEIDED